MSTKSFEKIILNPQKVTKYGMDKMLKGKERIVLGVISKFHYLGK